MLCTIQVFPPQNDDPSGSLFSKATVEVNLRRRITLLGRVEPL
jgi:hypothetical protein